jgi:hypothetical protein
MKKFLLYFLVFCLTPVTGANSDPANPISALPGSDNPSHRKITNIQVVSEKLYIRLGYYSEFTVKYVLWNRSNRDYIDIDYAFPVDYAGGGTEYENSGLAPDDYVKNISFYVNGNELPYKISDEVAKDKRESVDKKDFFPDEKILQKYSEKDRKTILENAQEEYAAALKGSKISTTGRRWFSIRFDIKAHQAVSLEVRYALRSTQIPGAYSSFFERRGSRCELKYDFSPVEYWGDGTAWSFNVLIDASELAVAPDFFEDPSNISIEGLPFTRKESMYFYTEQNFLFKDTPALSINYQLINNIPLSDWLNKRIPDEEYTITVSSEQIKYPASNLNDMDVSTVWTPPIKGGVNEKITIRFNQPTAVSDLVLVNGYHKSKKTYQENNRVKSIEINAEGQTYRNNKINKEERSLRLFFNDSSNDAYLPVDFENLKSHPDVSSALIAYPLDTFKVTKIELIIDDVYPGTKYDDLCVGEIILFRNEEKK